MRNDIRLGTKAVQEEHCSQFWDVFSGRFSGVLSWAAMDALWEQLRRDPAGWYVFDLTASVPEDQEKPEGFQKLLEDMSRYTRGRHPEDYCGFIYVDDADAPTFVKVFDPRAMGSSCGGGGKIYPRWIISKIAPEAVPTPKAPEDPLKALMARIFKLS